MAKDQGPVVQSALLRGELVRLRKDKGLTQDQVADDLQWSPSKLIRMESGRSLQALNREARERGWWDKYRCAKAPTYLGYMGYAAGASFIWQFETGFVPGLLQTADYAETVTIVDSQIGDCLDEDKILAEGAS